MRSSAGTGRRWRARGPAALRSAGAILAAAGLLDGTMPGCGSRAASEGGEQAPAAAVPVRLGRIVQRLFQPSVAAPGQWIAANELVVAAPFAALVDSLAPHAGDRVRRHEVLGWLVTRESHAAERGAELLLQQAADSTARAEATRALGLARRNVVRVPVTAAAAGTVLRRSVEPGAVLVEGAEILALVPDGALVFEAHVPLQGAKAVTPGRRARVVGEGGAALEGRVERLLPGTSAPDQSAVAWIAPLGMPPGGLLGRFGTAIIETGAPHLAPGVADSALVQDDLTGETRLARVDSAGVALWTPVRVGSEEGGWRELLAPGLPVGTAVVTSGLRGLPDSTRVRTRP